jgi:hypothetical protein
VEGDGIEARRRLLALPGLGPWTAGHLLRVAGGDPDAVEVGDYHVKHHVAWNLAGEPRADDERMLALLAPFTGHRGRVVRLLLSAGVRPPRYGPGRRVVPSTAGEPPGGQPLGGQPPEEWPGNTRAVGSMWTAALLTAVAASPNPTAMSRTLPS